MLLHQICNEFSNIKNKSRLLSFGIRKNVREVERRLPAPCRCRSHHFQKPDGKFMVVVSLPLEVGV